MFGKFKPKPTSFEDKYLDVLQNIEFAIIAVYRRNPRLTDYSVMDALEALINFYETDARGRKPRKFNLTALDQEVYAAAKTACEWRLGRSQMVQEDGQPLEAFDEAGVKTHEEIIACLKRLQSSAKFWHKERGRQGYLNYIQEFLS